MENESEKVIVRLGENSPAVEFPVLKASNGADVIDIRGMYKTLGRFTFDPGFVSTASCESKITFTDGQRGLLRYRGYPIEQLAEHSSFTETSYLLYYGELPTAEQQERFDRSLAEHGAVDSAVLSSLQKAFPQEAHPMAMLMAAMSYLAALYHEEKDVYDLAYREKSMQRIVAKMATLSAWVLCHRRQKPMVQPDERLSYSENFLRMAFPETDIKPFFVRAMDVILLLHADHEQNASTSTVRLSGSTETSPYAAVAAGIASLWGPAHGGANEAVVKMLGEIVSSGKPVEHFIEQAKDKAAHFRLMGFGHRVYKNYDPRAKIIRATCHRLLSEMEPENPNHPLLKAAMKLEAIALEDEYFVQRNLYPNVDFYSGIILSAINLPAEMFTVIFALARSIGWLSHWNEMMSNGQVRIYRPRQLYRGHQQRDYVSVDER